MKVIIVGGVAGGASAAARLRRLDEQAEITIYERSSYISYANCGLPYYLGEVITDKAALTLQTPESFFGRFQVTSRVRHEVTAIDAARQTVTVKNLQTGEVFTDTYDKLVLSPGAKALRPDIPGAEGQNVFTLRTVEDTLRIYDYIKESGAQTALVAGGGFVGLETAENLTELGIRVTLVEAAPQLLGLLDADMAAQVQAQFRAQGVRLILGGRLTAIEGKTCRLADGQAIDADLVLLAVGVAPDTELARQAGLKTAANGSIIVNDKMEASAPNIYAVGDAVAVEHFITRQPVLLPLAGPANKQGRIAADNIAGGDSRYRGTQGTSIIKLFKLTAAATGLNEAAARAAGLAYDKIILSPASHAGYYPSGQIMTIKIIFDKERDTILGAQIVGQEGVDKRIDVIATAIRAGLKASALAELELAYAPPYSSAKDPVNMAGFMIENLITGKFKQVFYEDLAAPAAADAFLLDCRTPAEYADGHALGFVNIPLDKIRDRLEEIPRDKPIYVMCQSGLRSYIATRMLGNRGYQAYNFAGGYRFYSMVAAEQPAAEGALPCGW